jgi:hypothetical protein
MKVREFKAGRREMKRAMILAALVLGGCNESEDNEAVGQVKKVVRQTPILCGKFNRADLSLGVMQNGTGSMSSHDEWFYVVEQSDYDKLKKAAESGKLVRVRYGVSRFAFCRDDHWITSVEAL